MSNSKVSLLIPIYNVEKYLAECLDSAVAQTLEDIEIICINDGSTDASLDIIKSYAERDKRVKIIDKKNSGYGASMNRGLDVATGEYIGILESDDFFEPDALESLYAAAKEHDADVCKANFWFFWSTPQHRNELFECVRPGEGGLATEEVRCDLFNRKPSIWSAIYRRSFLEEKDIRFLETPSASYQDSSFNFKVLAMARCIALVEKPIIHYRQDNEASSVNSPGKVYCICDEYAEMLRYLEGNNSVVQGIEGIVVRMRYDAYMWNYERLAEPLQIEFMDRMVEDFKREDAEGRTDAAAFEPWRFRAREEFITDPRFFHARGIAARGSGKLNTLKTYYRYGGLPYVKRLIAMKLGRWGRASHASS